MVTQEQDKIRSAQPFPFVYLTCSQPDVLHVDPVNGPHLFVLEVNWVDAGVDVEVRLGMGKRRGAVDTRVRLEGTI